MAQSVRSTRRTAGAKKNKTIDIQWAGACLCFVQ